MVTVISIDSPGAMFGPPGALVLTPQHGLILSITKVSSPVFLSVKF